MHRNARGTGRSGALAPGVALLGALVAAGCGGGGTSSPSAAGKSGDALFVAEAPALIPEEAEPDLSAMGIGRLYVVGATFKGGSRIEAYPPPPNKMGLPVVFTVVDPDGGAVAALGPDTKGELVGEGWAAALTKPLAEARGWSNVVGIHLHLSPVPAQAKPLASALESLRRATGLPVSVTLRPGSAPGEWKPLAGKAHEVLLFGFGRRPETSDQVVPEITEEAAAAFPVPFRLLLAVGSYGTGDGNPRRRIPDGEVDRMSEDRGLDFAFDQVLSAEPGNHYTFRPRAGVAVSTTLLARDGGTARFQVLPMADLVKVLASAARFPRGQYRGRAFLVDALPRDGHLLGFPALKALLTGKPFQPSVALEPASVNALKGGGLDVSLTVRNDAPTPTDLSHFDNWIQVRVEGGTVVGVQAGDFDRYEILTSGGPDARPASFGRATVVRLFENLFAPGETNQAGPIRVSGQRPHLFWKYRLVLPDGQTLDPPEQELALAIPTPEPPQKAQPRTKRK